MKADLIKIGNSQGIRIPSPFIKQCGFGKAVDIEVSGNSLIISPSDKRRAGWAKAFKLMHENGDDKLLDSDLIESEFDKTEWTW